MVAMVQKKTFAQRHSLLDRLLPVIFFVVLVTFGAMLIPVRYPLAISNGKIEPNVVHPGEQVKIEWQQNWYDLCPITVMRVFIGSDDIKQEARRFTVEPPPEKGVRMRVSTVTIPAKLPLGRAIYSAQITPHCWFDYIWQREYRTPDIAMTVVAPPPPAGPH